MDKFPERIGKYEVIRRLGYGGMGTVFLARDPDLDRLLAIKVVRDQMFDEQLLQRFLREARAAGNLRHDNIITVYDAGQHDHQPFMAMEYVDGVSFAEIIRSRQPLGLADKLSYLEQVCAGLNYAHGRGIVHRDVKPANLMVDRRHTVRILDFGIARVEGSGMTRDGSLIGTLNYMSPEQMLGRQVDHRSDIFAFGAVAYELIAYERAFPGGIDDGLLHRVPNEPPRSLSEACPGLPQDLEPLVMRALAKKPEDRFADLEEARVALRQIRRQIDPHVDAEPASGSRSFGLRGVATPTPGQPPSTERQEFLERRARQVAYHRDAARNALKANDLDTAAAACEDALTLDPDDREALQLLTEIEQAREQRGLETKERRERERIVRRHVANADLKLSKGDAAGAAELLRQALTLDPQNETARALLARAGAAGAPIVVAAPTVVRPQSRPRSGVGSGSGSERIASGTDRAAGSAASAGGAGSGASAGSSASGPAAAPSAAVPSPSATPAPHAATASPAAAVESAAAHATADGPSSPAKRYLAAGALAAAAILALILWSRSGGEAPSPDQVSARVDERVAAPADAGERASGDPDAAAPESTAREVSETTAAPGGASTPVDRAPAPAPSPRQETPAPPPRLEPQREPPVVPASRAGGPPAPAAAPAAPPAPTERGDGETAPVRTVVVPIDLGAVDRALASGDVAGALSQLEGLPNQSDERVRTAARRIAERAMDDMAAAETSAGVLKARELAATPFATASGAKTRAERAFEREDYSQTVRQAIAAASGFRSAADEARRAEEARRKADELAAAKAKEHERDVSKTADFDEAGAWSAMKRFQAAYSSRDVNAISKITTTLSSGAADRLRDYFRQCRDATVSFVRPAVLPVPNDPTAAVVTVRSSYVCVPKINAPPQEISRDEVFSLRKLRDTWLIERMGSWDTPR